MTFDDDRRAMERAMSATPEQVAALQDTARKLSPRAVVTAEDHAAALAIVTDWVACRGATSVSTADQLVLVGMIAATRADARAERTTGE